MGNLGSIIQPISSLLVFIGLYIAAVLMYKTLAWISDRAVAIGRQVRIQAMGFIFFFSLWWLLLDLPPFTYQVVTVSFVRSAMIFFAALITLDVLNNLLFDVYLPREKVNVPHIIVNLIRAAYVICIILFILHAVFHLDVRPFLTGSAILTAIIGLALQDTMGNFFSGLALHISKPFDTGNWIKMGEIEGVVTKIDWRAATIHTRQEDFVTVPNSQLAKAELVNYSAPSNLHGIYVDVGTRYEYPPNRIKAILLETAMKTEGVSREIPPEVYLVKYNDFSIDYRLRFFIDDFRAAPVISSAVMERIWYAFSRNNIEIPFPIQDVFLKDTAHNDLDKENLITILSRIDFLQGLSYEEVCDVANQVKVVVYAEGERIIRQGDMGTTFFIIKTGTVEVSAANANGDVFLVKELDAGNFFGEISLFTGELRTATIRAVTDVELLALTKENFETLLRKYPHMAQHISERIAARQKHSFEQMELARVSGSEVEIEETAQKQVESLSRQLLQKIRNFFSIGKA